MLKIDVLAGGKARFGGIMMLWEDYKGRLSWPVTLHESDDLNKLAAKIDPRAFLFVLDEKGKSLRSTEFAQKLGDLADGGQNHVQFLIGAADGVPDDIKKRAHFLLSFGQQTWPHMLVRVMLIEQIYRARQILAGHPYHREG